MPLGRTRKTRMTRAFPKNSDSSRIFGEPPKRRRPAIGYAPVLHAFVAASALSGQPLRL
jgi:hypothetical protein